MKIGSGVRSGLEVSESEISDSVCNEERLDDDLSVSYPSDELEEWFGEVGKIFGWFPRNNSKFKDPLSILHSTLQSWETWSEGGIIKVVGSKPRSSGSAN